MNHALRPFIAGFILVISTVAFAQTPKNHSDSKGRQGVWKIWLKRNFDESDDSTLAPYYRICTYKDGLAKGPFKDHYRSGALFREGTLKTSEGKFYIEGTVKQYRETGSLEIVEEYLKGKRQGNYRKYAVNGHMVAEGEMDDGKRVGEWKTFYENGKVKLRGSYVDGDQDGEWTAYNEDGTVKETTLFDHGRVIDWSALLDRAIREIDKNNVEAAQRTLESATSSIMLAFGPNTAPAARLQFTNARLHLSEGNHRLASLSLDSAVRKCDGLGFEGKGTLLSGIDGLIQFANRRNDTAFVTKLMPLIRSLNRDPDQQAIDYAISFSTVEINDACRRRDAAQIQDAIENAKARLPLKRESADKERALNEYIFWMNRAVSLYRASYTFQGDLCYSYANADSIVANVQDLDSLRSLYVNLDVLKIANNDALTTSEVNEQVFAIIDRQQNGDQHVYCNLLVDAATSRAGPKLIDGISKRLTSDCLERLSTGSRGALDGIAVLAALGQQDCERAYELFISTEQSIKRYYSQESLQNLRNSITRCMSDQGTDSLPSLPPLFTTHIDTTPASREATLRAVAPGLSAFFIPAMSANATTEDMLKALIVADTLERDPDLSVYLRSYRSIVDNVRQFVLKHQSPVKQAEALFRILHDSVLKKYVSGVALREVYTTGRYNCISAVALYGLLCREFDIPIAYYKAPSHITCGIPDKGQVVFVELTSPKKGFNFTQIRDSVIDHLLEYKLVTREEIDKLGRDSVFRSYHEHRRAASFASVLSGTIGNMLYRNLRFFDGLNANMLEPALAHMAIDSTDRGYQSSLNAVTFSNADIRSRFFGNSRALAAYYHGNAIFFDDLLVSLLPTLIDQTSVGEGTLVDSLLQSLYDHAPITSSDKLRTSLNRSKAAINAYRAHARGHLDTSFAYLRTYTADSIRSDFKIYYQVAEELISELVDQSRQDLALRIAREEVAAHRCPESRFLLTTAILWTLSSESLSDMSATRHSELVNEAFREGLDLTMASVQQQTWVTRLAEKSIIYARYDLADTILVAARRARFGVDALNTVESTLKIMRSNRQIPIDPSDVTIKVSVRLSAGNGPETNIIAGTKTLIYLRFEFTGLKIGQTASLSAEIRGGGADPGTTATHAFGATDGAFYYWFPIPVHLFKDRRGTIEITPRIDNANLDPIKVTVQP